MARRECEGPACTNSFEAARSTARYCGTTCRSRAARARKATAAAAEIDAQAEADQGKDGNSEHELVTVTRRELEEAGALHTVAGQLALNLARKLVDVDAKGVASLTRELSRVLAEAKGAAKQPTDGGADDADGNEGAEEDEVAAAREARRRARQEAGLA